MKRIRLLLIVGFLPMVSFLSADELPTQTKPLKARVTIANYMQADNNLSPFALYNINDMQLASLPDSVNMLVQWDQPDNNRTWRYRITHGGRIEDASLSTEMGINPEQEIVDMMRWAKSKYDAEHWVVILWNHGYGVIDPRHKSLDKMLQFGIRSITKQAVPWLEIPGLEIQKAPGVRGILFDDSQNTYATNQNLSNAFARIKSDVIGKNIDIVGMDACLMAMIEVAYQIKNSVDIFVGSQQTEPGEGWSYSGFLNPLCLAPTKYTSKDLAITIVSTYATFYKGRVSDYTQSAIKLSAVDAIKANIQDLMTAVAACEKVNKQTTKQIVTAARRGAISFAVSDYIDLYSFYAGLVKQLKKYRTPNKAKPVSKSFTKAATQLLQIVTTGMSKINTAVIANAAGPQLANVKGISIYYPMGKVYSSYSDCTFEQQIHWGAFTQKYH
jgi:hypothetical protein